MASFDLSNNQLQNKNNKKTKIWGTILVILCSVLFLILFTNFLPNLQKFLLGLFGLFIYPLTLIVFTIGIALINNKKYVMPLKYIIYLTAIVYLVLGIINAIILGKPETTMWEYFGLTYNSITAGGIFAALLLAPSLYTIGLVGTIVVYLIGLIICVALVIDFLNSIKVYGFKAKEKKEKIRKVEVQQYVKPIKERKEIVQEIVNNEREVYNQEKDEFNVFLNNKLAEEQKIYEAKIKLGLIEGNLDSAKSSEKPKSLKEHLLTPPPFESLYFSNSTRKGQQKEINDNVNYLKYQNPNNNFSTTVQKPSNNIISNKPIEEKPQAFNQNENFGNITIENNSLDLFDSSTNIFNNMEISKTITDNHVSAMEEKVPIVDDYFEEEEYFEEEDVGSYKQEEEIVYHEQKPKERKFAQLEEPEPIFKEKPRETLQQNSVYIRPPLELLEERHVDMTALNQDVVGKKEMLEHVMEEFNINAKVIGVVVGPSVTRYELEMPPGVSVKKIVNHEDDISLALAARSGIRIEAPIPGKSAVGIEVPNDNIAMVGIREIIDSPEFVNNGSPISFTLGKDISGTNQMCNIGKMPHLLIAGATNSGKSICLNTILISILYKASPEDVRLILIDPKRVEFSMYNDLPHLLMPNVITEVEMATNALTWAIHEMEQRFSKLQETRCRNLDEYNKLPQVLSGEVQKMPYIVIMIDELNDLMSSNKKEIEEKIMRLAQKSRAAGIHLIIATQRPSVDVITGTIKANFPSRISFALTSFADSKTILDLGGAESLLGKGDMLYKPSDVNSPKRIQGCYVSGEEVVRVVEFVKEHNPQNYDEEVEKALKKEHHAGNFDGVINGDKNWDPYLPQVLKMFIQNGQASISAAQRRFVIGHPRAARITDQLCQMGYISEGEGSKPRTVYITMEEFYEKFGQID